MAVLVHVLSGEQTVLARLKKSRNAVCTKHRAAAAWQSFTLNTLKPRMYTHSYTDTEFN